MASAARRVRAGWGRQEAGARGGPRAGPRRRQLRPASSHAATGRRSASARRRRRTWTGGQGARFAPLTGRARALAPRTPGTRTCRASCRTRSGARALRRARASPTARQARGASVRRGAGPPRAYTRGATRDVVGPQGIRARPRRPSLVAGPSAGNLGLFRPSRIRRRMREEKRRAPRQVSRGERRRSVLDARRQRRARRRRRAEAGRPMVLYSDSQSMWLLFVMSP